ncbi:MAG: beta-propeller domain-containing protein [Methanoregula sp.]
MVPKNTIVLILSGIISGIILAYLVMTAFSLQMGETSSSQLPIQPALQQKVMPGAEEPLQFSSQEDARAFLRTHTEGYDEPQLLTDVTGPVDTREWSTANGTRTWRFDVDTSTFKPDEYIVTADAILQQATGTALFNVLDSPQGRISQRAQGLQPIPVTGKYFITINPIGDRYVGEKFTITGRTNLAADDEMLVQVYSSSFKPTQKSQSGEFSGSTGTIRASSSSQPAPVSMTAPAPETNREYSTTNVQVKDVDEADIIKTDGTYLYVVTGNHVHILHAYPANTAEIISTLQFSGSPQSLYLHGDRLVLISSEYKPRTFMNCPPGACGNTMPTVQKTRVFVYSIKDPAHPALQREMEMDGAYKDTRMIGSMLYFVTTDYIDLYADDVAFPEIYDSRRGSSVPPVYYFDKKDREYSLTTVGAVDIIAGDPIKAKTFLIGSAGTLYVSPDRLYIAIASPGDYRTPDKTDLYAFALNDGLISFAARGTVDGTLLNQFSMDEYEGNLRIATTVQDRGGPRNTRFSKVSVLDNHMSIMGSVDNLAPGERIYAARFMGDRLYLVTFRETDPLFVIDLSDPARPMVLGELHIPGYSSYLHPYDATHLIGVGKQSTWGGLKLALFDVADVHNPRLIDEEKMGGYGSDSEILTDHKAFLFDREKDLLVLPVHLVEDATSVNGWRHSIWGGAYVFGVDPDNGFTRKGTVVHYRDTNGSYHEVKRALYIEDTLYTMSQDKIVMSDLRNATRLIGAVGLR